MNKDFNKRVFVSLAVAAMLASLNISKAAERQVINEGETVNFNGQSFSNLEYNGNGGAVNNAGDLTINRSGFASDTAANGGAIYSTGTIESIMNSAFDGNKATGTNSTVNMAEGWTYNESTGKVSDGGDAVLPILVQSGNVVKMIVDGEVVGTITYNGIGGAIYNTGTIDSITNSTFTNNSAKIAGGAIYNGENLLTIDNVLFDKNKVESSDTDFIPVGGAVYSQGDIEINQATFSNNTALSDYEEDGISGKAGQGGALATSANADISKSLFVSNTAAQGGAIYADDSSFEGAELVITGSEFNKNIASYEQVDGSLDTSIKGDGGAIYTEADTTISNSAFTSNKAGDKGGAIYANQLLNSNITDATFASNIAGNAGGAIYYNEGDTITIDNSIFDGNTSLSGGAIAANNVNELLISNSVFKNNKAVTPSYVDPEEITDTDIDSDSDSDIGDTDSDSDSDIGDTDDDTDSDIGDTDDDTDSDIGDTDDDTDSDIGDTDEDDDTDTDTDDDDADAPALAPKHRAPANNNDDPDFDDANGGALWIKGGEQNITASTFEGNFAENKGGAIFVKGSAPNDLATLDISGSKFVSNKAGEYGGAIYAGEYSVVTIDNSKFENNSAKNGGALYNGTASEVTLIDTDFTGNTATEYGGAIYAGTDNTTIKAQTKDVTFKGNSAKVGNDIYLGEEANLNIDAAEGRKITFSSGITSNASDHEIHINNNGIGTVVLDSFLTKEAGGGYNNITVSNGTLQINNENYLNNTANLTMETGSTLDLINGKTGTVNLNSFESNDAKINIDMDLQNSEQPSDLLVANNADGSIYIEKINLLSDFADGQNSITIDLEDAGVPNSLVVTTDGGVNTITNNGIYTVNADADNHVLNINRMVDGSGDTLTGDMFTVAVNQNDTVGGIDVSLANNRTFSMTDDITVTGENTTGWTGDLSGTSLSVYGNGHTINGASKTGIYVDDGKTLSLQDTNVQGFAPSNTRKGVFTVAEGGKLNVSAINNDVTIGGSSGTNNNAIYLEGTSENPEIALATLSTGDGRTLTFNDAIRSADRANELRLTGSGTIKFNGVVDPVTITNENKNTIHNNYIDNVTYNLNNGTVSFTKDAYLNGEYGNNILNFNGGALNLANGAVGTINLQGLNLNSNSNILVDADLAKSQMDKFNVYSENVSGSGNLNVSGINLLSDAKSKTTQINFVDPSITMGDGSTETLASHITSSVGEIAYSPIYKYGVAYDDQTGNFTFTRGAGKSPDNPNAYNPAVLVAPVAAQAGGYMAMLDTYANGFANMDLRMLSPLKSRMALRDANKYALEESTPVKFAKSEYNASGMYLRPYTAFDSVNLRRGPKVNNLAYGTFLGSDSSVHVFKNGAEGVFSPFIAYQGNHQNFKGNSVFQNGGTIGFTGTLYKGNFFTGLTAGIGMNVSEASTMYGHEDFPMLIGGVASKTGYNIEFKEGRFIIQPSFLISYTVANAFNYTNKAGVSIHSDALHAIQLSPNVKFILNTKNGWQPYATVGMMWNLLDETKFTANDVGLPEMSIRPYVQYGLGVQKNIGDRVTAYGQITGRNGGRNGIAAFIGGRMMLGFDDRSQYIDKEGI